MGSEGEPVFYRMAREISGGDPAIEEAIRKTKDQEADALESGRIALMAAEDPEDSNTDTWDGGWA